MGGKLLNLCELYKIVLMKCKKGMLCKWRL